MQKVYIHRRLDGSPFYVGMGVGNRHRSKQRSDAWKEIAKDGYEIDLIHTCECRNEAIECERAVIEWIGLDKLTNKHKGGQGGNQYVRTEKHLNILKSNGRKQGAINGKNANYKTQIVVDGQKYSSKRAYARAMDWTWSSKVNNKISTMISYDKSKNKTS